MNPKFQSLALYSFAAALGSVSPAASAAGPQDQLASYVAQAGSPGRPDSGRALFLTNHGREWSCASCHGERPTGTGRHALTGKGIGPMSPLVNGERFTNPAKTEKWFRRNCMDVLARECSAQEKADILSWLISLKP